MSVDAVTAAPEVQPGHRLGLGLGAFERAAFLVVADLGRDHVEDPPTEAGQVGGAELLGVLDQPLLGQLLDLVGDVVGQRVEGLDDDPGLVEVHPPVGQRGGDVAPGVSRAWASFSCAYGDPPVDPGAGRDPVRDGAAAVVGGDVTRRRRPRRSRSASWSGRRAGVKPEQELGLVAGVQVGRVARRATEASAFSIASAHASTGCRGGWSSGSSWSTLEETTDNRSGSKAHSPQGF